jgi:hypothetical protein
MVAKIVYRPPRDRTTNRGTGILPNTVHLTISVSSIRFLALVPAPERRTGKSGLVLVLRQRGLLRPRLLETLVVPMSANMD